MVSQLASAYQPLICLRGAHPGNCSYITVFSTRVVKSVIIIWVMYLNSWPSQAGRCNVSRQEKSGENPIKINQIYLKRLLQNM